jgi:DNA sulfur modification protein DndD
MKLEQIVIENFRQYYGRQRLTFAKDSRRNVTVIQGVNGSGKTSLFLAINWCLYGRGDREVKIVDNVGELISKEEINQANIGDEVKTSVELSFQHDGERYLLKRSLTGKKISSHTIRTSNFEEFTMMRIRADGQANRIKNPVGTINAILPPNVREYFLFDGEKIDNFAKAESSEQVKQAIYLVLKLEVLERSRRHLESVASEYRKGLKSISSGELRNLIENYEGKREERDKANFRIGELKTESDSANKKILEIDQRLREIQSAKLLQDQRDRIQGELKLRRSESEDTVRQIQELAIESYPILAERIIVSALELLDEKRKRGEIPSNIRKQFIEDLIKNKVCICGRKFELGDNEHKHLTAILENSVSGFLEDLVLDTTTDLRSFSERRNKQIIDITMVMGRRNHILDQIKGLEEELDDIGRQLKESDLEEISGLERKRQDYRADIDSYSIEIGSLNARIELLGKEISFLEKEITKARKEESKQRELIRKFELAQNSADAIAEMYLTFADEMRKRIERKTKEIFKLLIWKESHFTNIELDSDFNLHVIDRYGMPARPELSAGERQVLSLSFIAAMSRVSEEEAPIVMDTPFGRLSSAHRNSITEHIPELASQLILFVTDEELREQSRANLDPRIGMEYLLDFDSDTSCTTINEV